MPAARSPILKPSTMPPRLLAALLLVCARVAGQCPANEYEQDDSACAACPEGSFTQGDERGGPGACVADEGSLPRTWRTAAGGGGDGTTDGGVFDGHGMDDGTGTTASFYHPWGVAAADSSVYVSDAGNHAIRVIDDSGVATTLAGSGGSGFENGSGAAATFSGPRGLAFDPVSRTLYVADCFNNAIRAIDTDTGAVGTLAGQGSTGFDDGAAASFHYPSGVSFEPVSGSVFVADSGNHAVRSVDSGGNVATLAGTGTTGFADGTGVAASFHSPRALAYDAAAQLLYVADMNNHAIRSFAPATGAVTTVAGTGFGWEADDGIGTMAAFWSPNGIAVSLTGALLVADYSNHAIRHIVPDSGGGVVTTIAGTSTSGFKDGVGTDVRFEYPIGEFGVVTAKVAVRRVGPPRLVSRAPFPRHCRPPGLRSCVRRRLPEPQGPRAVLCVGVRHRRCHLPRMLCR